MRKKVITILAMCAILIFALMGCTTSTLEEKKLSTKNDAKLNTLILSDVCFDGSKADEVRKKIINQALTDKKNVEFIAITGNLVNAQNNDEIMKKAVEFVDSLGIPWAMSLGELDVKGKANAKQIMKILTNKNLKNSYVMRGDSYLNNYCLKVEKSNGQLIDLMFFVDTSVACTKEFVEWYQNIVKNISMNSTQVQGTMINSHIFMNRPLPVFRENEQVSSFDISVWKDSVDFEKAIKNLKSTKSVATGFDPVKSYYINKGDIHFAHISTMSFDSSMKTNDKDFIERANQVGVGYYEYDESKYVHITNIHYSPITYAK